MVYDQEGYRAWLTSMQEQENEKDIEYKDKEVLEDGI